MKSIACLALIAAGLASQAHAAASSRRSLDLECFAENSTLSAYVIHYGNSPALFVYDGDEELLAAWSTESISTLGAVTTASYAAGGSIFDGGASLRVRLGDSTIPANTGAGNLLIKADGRTQNALMECHPY